MQLFLEPNFTFSSTSISINAVESRHIVKVLRKQAGDELVLTNGKGLLANGVLINAHPKNCVLAVTNIQEKTPSISYLHIAIAPTKANDRFEWFLEKATEIGIQEITPLLCEHSERRIIKLERYQKVLQAAMKQSLSPFLPKLNDLTSFSDFVSTPTTPSPDNAVKSKFSKCIAHCEDQPKEKLSQLIGSHNLILIGPEGDFSTSEIDLALKKGFKAVSLSNSRLRTETAGIVACHTANLIPDL